MNVKYKDTTVQRIVDVKTHVKPHDSIKPPRIVLADTCPKPQTFTISDKAKEYKVKTAVGERTRMLLPPEIKPAGFFAHMQNFTTDNGLPFDVIHCSCIDHLGNIWFGIGGGGLSRYDGKSFSNYTTLQGLCDNDIYCIAADKNGNIWIGTDGSGVSRYDGKSFTSFSTKQGLANNDVRCIYVDKSGNVWFGTYGGGVSKYNGKSFTNYTKEQGLPNNTVFSILEDKAGKIWFGTMGGGISCYDGKSYTNYTTTQGLARNSVRGMIEDKNGNIWIATYGSGVSKFDGKTFTNYNTEQGLSNNVVWSILEDKTGNIWFSTLGGGVSCFDGKTFTNYTTEQGLANNDIWSMLMDKTGNLWISTLGGGADCYNGNAFTNYTTMQGLCNNQVASIFEDSKGNLWVGTIGGMSCFNGKTFTNYTIAQGLANNTVLCMLEDKKGNLWFGTEYDGISFYDGKSFTNYRAEQGLISNIVLSMVEDNSGNIWIGTDVGLSCYNGKTFTNYKAEQGLPSDGVCCIHKDKKGNLWFGTNRGLSCYNGKSFTNYTTATGLGNRGIFSILEDSSGNLWIGAEDGVIRYDGKSFIKYGKEQGLPDDGVTSVVMDKQEEIVVGTNTGMAVLKYFTSKQTGNNSQANIPAPNNLSNSQLENYKPVFEIFNSKTGYPVPYVNGGSNNGAMICDSKGIVWIGTASDKTALVRFDPPAVNRNPNPPTVVIKGIQINEESVCWYLLNGANRKEAKSMFTLATKDSIISAQQETMTYGKILTLAIRDSIRHKYEEIKFDSITSYYPLPQNLVLPYKDNHITFNFNAIETDRPNLVNYQYILEGYDKDWSPITKASSANFGNIFEGTYIFKLKAQSPFGIWSEPITYTFKVLPPWYRTWWAYLLYALSILTLLYLIFRWRTAALRQRQKELEQTVTERTSELVSEKKKSDDLLLNILPAETAEELKATGEAKAKSFSTVTVMFTDFKDFTKISEKLSPAELVADLHSIFQEFDNIIHKYGIEKIKTIGDSYMAAGGLPMANETHPKDVVNAALEILHFIETHKQQRIKEGKPVFEIRIGINTGPVVAGIVGVKKFAYDIWGDTVNLASRMESSGEPGKINISGSTYELVKNDFTCTYRGKIQAKNKGEVDMYFVK